MPCMKCGSNALVEEVRVIDRADYNVPLALTVQVDRKPGALLFNSAVTNKVEARVCGDCGFLEMYVKNPGALMRAAETRNRERAAKKRAGK